MAGLFRIGGRHRSGGRYPGAAGLSLVELLIVMAVIGLIAGLAVPLMFRMGLFSGNKVELATRELYSALRAAKIYSSTHGVDAGIAYSGLLGIEDSYTGQEHPIVDAYATVRSLKREELQALGLSTSSDYYVPVAADSGIFVDLPRETCLLPDLFRLVGTEDCLNVQPVSAKGLLNIRILDPEAGSSCLEPRFPYMVEVQPSTGSEPDCGGFPAHIFKPSGEIRVKYEDLPQRLEIRVGLLPDEDVSERFTVDPNTVRNQPAFDNTLPTKPSIPIQFQTANYECFTLYRHPDPSLSETEYVDNDRRITLYRSQGRIKIEP